MIPEIDPEHFVEMSVHVVYRMADAAKLNPAAIASCRRAAVLFEVWLPDHSNNAEPAMPNQAVARRPFRFPSFCTARSESQPPKGTMTILARNGAEPQKLAFETVTPRTFTK